MHAAEQNSGACQQQLQALGTAVVDLAGLLKGAAVNVSQGCTKATPGSGCSVKEAFGVDLATLSAKQGCSSKLVLLPHQDVRDTSAWPEPYTGAARLHFAVAMPRLSDICSSCLRSPAPEPLR